VINVRLTKKIISIVLVLFLAACAGKKPPGHPKPPPGSHQTPVSPSGEEETPERIASNALIDDGEKIFSQGRYDSAADLFQQAVTVDPSNGSAYYHLALAKVRSGEYGDAEGLIEKADQLLGHDPNWAERLEDLKREFHQKNPDERR
jgi:Tfp pilus assembly protein PilF